MKMEYPRGAGHVPCRSQASETFEPVYRPVVKNQLRWASPFPRDLRWPTV